MNFNHDKLEINDNIGEIVVGSIIERKADRIDRNDQTKNTIGEVIEISDDKKCAVIRNCYGKELKVNLDEFELAHRQIFEVGDLVKDTRSDAHGKIIAIDPSRKTVTMSDNGFTREVSIWKLQLVSDELLDGLINKSAKVVGEAKNNFRETKIKVKKDKEKAAA